MKDKLCEIMRVAISIICGLFIFSLFLTKGFWLAIGLIVAGICSIEIAKAFYKLL